MFQFYHAADIHLDSPLTGLARYPGAPVERLREATRQALETLVQRVIDDRAAFLVIAGDLYDGDWRDFNTGLFFVRQMGLLREAGIPVFVLHGNHDAASRMTRALTLPDNVRVFPSAAPRVFHIDALKVALVGQSFPRPEVTENLAARYPDPEPGWFTIGVLHTALEGRSGHASYAPCTLEELVAKGYDYWALGHVHAGGVLHEHPPVVFAGNLQGRHAGETGSKGAMRVTVAEGAVTALEPVACDGVRWAVVTPELDGVESLGAILERVEKSLAQLAAAGSGRLWAVRLHLPLARRWLEAVLAREEFFLAEVRALAAAMAGDGVWIEKIVPVAHEGEQPARIEGLDLLDGLLREAEGDEALRAGLREGLEEMFAKLPAEVRQGVEGELGRVREGEVAVLMAQAVALLRGRIRS